MIESLTQWLESFLKADSPIRLCTVFFRLLQILNAAGVIFLFITLGSEGHISISIVLQALLFGLGNAVFAEIGLRLVEKGNIYGFWIGLYFSIVSLFGLKFLLGALGLYAFLNPGSQKLLLQNAPEWFKKLLSDLKLNFIFD